MTVQILFFASLREAVGRADLRLDITEGDYTAMREALINQLGGATDPLWEPNVRVAHNQQLLADPEATLVLADGDEVAFLPPVTGG